MKQTFQLKALSAAIITACFATNTSGQEQKKVDNNEQIEVIEVTGFKSSLRKAMNAKRFANSVIDSIHAEDVGKSTDQNIADALSRVTGVTVQESDGEGTRISVRGAGAHLNQISLNGVALTSGIDSGAGEGNEANQSVDLSAFSSDILASIDVIKTSAADQDEGSLGASVILRTVKPLNLKNQKRNFEYQARYNQYSAENDRKISATFSEKMFDDTVGFIVTASDETQKVRSDELTYGWDADGVTIKDGQFSDLAGKRIRVVDYGQTEADLANWNPSTDRLHTGDLVAMGIKNNGLTLRTSEKKRQSITAGFQFLPTNDTEIQLDISHSKLEVRSDNTGMFLDFKNNEERVLTDPNSTWNVLDYDRQTVVKTLSRYPTGSFNRSTGGYDTATSVITLTLNHEITDDLSAKFLAGYSRTNDDNIGTLSTSTATWKTTSAGLLEEQDLNDITPIGYDCRQGGNCFVTLGSSLGELDPITQKFTKAGSRFNPYDINANHLSGLNSTDHSNTDTNKSVFLDFDWAVDFAGFTEIEFGGKWAQRIKDVNTKKTSITSGTQAIYEDDENNELVILSAAEPSSIKLADIIEPNSAFPVDNFLDGLLPEYNEAYLNGWPMLSAERAYTEIFNKAPGSSSLVSDPSGSRIIEQDVESFYTKINFEYLDGRLSGNVGLRYVKTDVKAQNYTSVKYQNSVQHINPYDLVYNAQVANMSLPVCDTANYSGGNANNPPINYYADTANDEPGLGGVNFSQNEKCYDWHLTHAYQIKDETTFPSLVEEGGRQYLAGWQPSVFDGSTSAWQAKASTIANDNSILFAFDYSDPTNPVQLKNDWYATNFPDYALNESRGKESLKPWLDRSSTVYNASGITDQKAFLRSSLAKDTHTYTNLLPSLNLNYAINDEMIARFAVSKTMARPRFDSVTPGINISNSYWSERDRGVSKKTTLDALESNNLDLAFEWYFNDSGLAGITLFHKDMTNFEESITTPYHWRDVRLDYDLPQASASYLLMAPLAENTPQNSGCMAKTFAQGDMSAQDFGILCKEINIKELRNGKGATTQGVELNYNQNYDFLPGLLSGLGLSFNYTFADSEKDIEVITTTGDTLLPAPQEHTPKHSSNTTIYWEKDGFEMRLAHRYNSITYLGESGAYGRAWAEATNRLDFSSSYNINKNISLTFHALNLTDEIRRTFYTSTKHILGVDEQGNNIVLEEGNPMEDNSVNSSRTLKRYKTGRQFRLGLRASF